MENTLDQMIDAAATRKAQLQQLQAGLDRFAQQIAAAIGFELTPTTTTDEIVAAVAAKLASGPETPEP